MRLVAGNHDINTREVVSYVDNGLRGELTSTHSINQFIDKALSSTGAAVQAALGRVDNFRAFSRSFMAYGRKSDSVFLTTQVFPINGLTIGIATLNSAWRATGTSNDKGNLIVGERIVDLAIKDLDGAHIKICVLHHPPEWLLEADAAAIESRLERHFDLICLGHIHRPVPKHIQSANGSAVVSQCGTLYAGRTYFNGYQIITWDENNRSVDFDIFTYFDAPRREFAPAENICPRGKFHIPLPPRTAEANLSETELFLRQARPIVRANADDQFSFTREKDSPVRDTIADSFVCPPLNIRSRAESTIAQTQELDKGAITAENLLRRKDHIILIGEPETGRTSLAHYLSVRVAEGVSDKARIPAVINMRAVAQTGLYDRALKSYYVEADISAPGLAGAVQRLPWLVFIDDVTGTEPSHIDIVKKIREKHPDHRLLLVADSSAERELRAVLGPDVTAVTIGYLSRRGIRQLSRVRYPHSLDDGADDESYNLVMRHIIDARLPRTGYIVTLLLWAAEQRKLGANLNEAVLLENLIAFLLGKANFGAALRDQFDPRAQELLLIEVAMKLRGVGGCPRGRG